MTQLHVGDWACLQAQAMPLRRAVFAVEQGIAETLLSDEADATAIHAVLSDAQGEPLATGRVVPLAGGGRGKLGRMAVRADRRGQGLGSRVLEALLAQARQRGMTEVMLHAQASAVGFYARHGFEPQGEPFQEAGLPHQTMVRHL